MIHQKISIHALLAESDACSTAHTARKTYFYPRSPCGERHFAGSAWVPEFPISIHALLAESDPICRRGFRIKNISIHALLAESDRNFAGDPPPIRISIHALLAESDSFNSKLDTILDISIHALLAESDPSMTVLHCKTPISIHALLAESDAGGNSMLTLIQNFYPRSPCGERRTAPSRLLRRFLFLSTLSLRRATHLLII